MRVYYCQDMSRLSENDRFTTFQLQLNYRPLKINIYSWNSRCMWKLLTWPHLPNIVTIHSLTTTQCSFKVNTTTESGLTEAPTYPATRGGPWLCGAPTTVFSLYAYVLGAHVRILRGPNVGVPSFCVTPLSEHTYFSDFVNFDFQLHNCVGHFSDLVSARALSVNGFVLHI